VSSHPSITKNNKHPRGSSRVGGLSSLGSHGASFFEADTQRPESSSPDGNSFCPPAEVGERAQLIQQATPACRRVVAQRDDGRWLCLSCIEPHTINAPSGPGAYSPERYLTTEKARREARVHAGLCAECSRPRGLHGSARLCEIHRAKSATRKRRMRERIAHGLRDNLYGHRADIVCP